MADVDFELFQINNFKFNLLNVSSDMDDRKDEVESAVNTIKRLVSSAQEMASRSMATMSGDRDRAYTVMSHNKKKAEEINSELGNLRNSNTEGCNNSAIKSKESELKSVRGKISKLQDIINGLEMASDRMESAISKLKSLLYKVESARDRFYRCFGENGYQGEILRLSKKADEAYTLGDRALHALALEDRDYNVSNRLSIINIEALRRSAEGFHDEQKSISNACQNMTKRAYEYSEMMQSEVMRNSFLVLNEITRIGQEYSSIIGKSGNALKEAYGYLYRYKNLLN